MIAQQVTITVQDGQQWAVLDALAAALGPGAFLGLALRRVAVLNGTRHELSWQAEPGGAVQAPAVDGDPVGADSDTATNFRGSQPDGEALRDLFSQHGFALESGRLDGSLRAIRGAFRGGMSLGDLGAGLSKARAHHGGGQGGGKKGSVPAIWCDTSTKHYGGRTYTYLRLRWPDASKKCGRGCRTIYKF